MLLIQFFRIEIIALVKEFRIALPEAYTSSLV